MTKEQVVPLVAFLILIAVAIAIVIACLINKKHKNIVKTNSERLKLLESLNIKYHFFQIQKNYVYLKSCTSKANFDKTDLVDYFRIIILDALSDFDELLHQTRENRKHFELYCADFNELKNKQIPFDISIKLSEKRFNTIEMNLMEKYKLCPVTDFIITVKKEFTSPQGRNHYADYFAFNYDETVFQRKQAMDIKQKDDERKTSKKYQRSLMTDSLRYDVMKRDNFRCKLCGLSADDGAVLHVDHIVPVAKGGKTEMSNLRTLCDRCNLGKRDKYDEDGIN